MTDAFASVNGQRLTSVRVIVGNTGPWFADLELEGASELAGQVTITIGALQLLGTVVAQQAGTFGEQRKCRIVAGAGGWGTLLRPKSYHNDAGIKAQLIAADAARECGETLGDFVPAAERVGSDFVRRSALASGALEQVIGAGVAWWVDYAGVTHVGSRPASAIPATSYEVLAHDPRTRIVTLAVDDPGAVGVGSTLTERLDAPQTVRDLELHLDAGEFRVTAWCGGSGAEPGRLAGLLQGIARRATDAPLLGKYRYRVVRMAVDGRVELQAVSKTAGLPDLSPISMWPGMAGVHAVLTPGAEVLVEFVEGSRTMPIVSHFAGKDGAGFVPVSIAFCNSAQAAARQGDLVQSGGVGTVVTLMPLPPAVVGAPPNSAVVTGVPHLISFSSTAPTALTADPLYGAVSTGSPKVFL
jgi:hypothetical protein